MWSAGPTSPAFDFPRCVALRCVASSRRHRDAHTPPSSYKAAANTFPSTPIHPLRALSLALLPPPAASSPTRANRRRRRCLPSAASQPVLFPRPGQLELPLRAFLATTTWTGLDGRCRLSPRLAPSPRPVFGVAVFWALPGPVALPASLFAFPTPACPGAQHRSNHGGALGSFLTSARRCPPPPRRQITPRLFFSFLFFLSLRCCFATSCCLLPPPFFRLSLFRSLHQPHPPNRASVRFLFRRGRPHLGPIRCCCAGRVLPPSSLLLSGIRSL